MKQVEIVKGISSSVLGFGCAPVLGSVDAITSRRALDCAMDCGITHFDLARSYGYGEAEKFVGKVMKGKRQNIALASKFGIIANWKARTLRPIKPIVRYFRTTKTAHVDRKLPIQGSFRIAKPDRFHDRIKIDRLSMQSSLEKSLKALQTDYLDYYFIHEPYDTIQNFGDVEEMAERLKEQGKIRAWGIAFMKEQEKQHETYISHFDVLQFNNSPQDADYQMILKKRANEPNIFFSPFRSNSQITNPLDILNSMFEDFNKSVVLCSMFKEAHIVANAKAASGKW